MIRTVEQICLYSDNRVSGKYSLCHGLLKSLFNGGVEVLGNAAAEYRLAEFKALACTGRKFYLYMAVLTVAAGLLLVLAFDLDLFLYRFAVRYLCGRYVTVVPKRFLSLEVMTSMCISPNPYRHICLVSALFSYLTVWSSSSSLEMPVAILSSSPLALGEIARQKYGVGNFISGYLNLLRVN